MEFNFHFHLSFPFSSNGFFCLKGDCGGEKDLARCARRLVLVTQLEFHRTVRVRFRIPEFRPFLAVRVREPDRNLDPGPDPGPVSLKPRLHCRRSGWRWRSAIGERGVFVGDHDD